MYKRPSRHLSIVEGQTVVRTDLQPSQLRRQKAGSIQNDFSSFKLVVIRNTWSTVPLVGHKTDSTSHILPPVEIISWAFPRLGLELA